jgi:class 3 adenylate cyclase
MAQSVPPPDAVGGEGDVRISDDDRNRVVEFLRTHTGDGRLTLDEFSERVGEVFAARTQAELEHATRDLPVAAPMTPTGEVDTYRRKPVHWTVGIMNGTQQKGRWRPGEETGAVAIMGGVVLDLRKAEIDGPTVTINAVAIMGGIDIIVPEGIAVELSGLNIMGAKELRISDAPRLPGTPIVRVDAFVLMGSVVVRNKRPKPEGASRPVLPNGMTDDDLDPRTVAHQRREEHIRRNIERHEERRRERMGQIQHKVERHRERIERELDRVREYWPEGQSVIDAVASTVGIEPLRQHAAPDGTVTILFSDIEGSTALLERLGDQRWVEVLREHRTIVRGQLQAFGGYEVSSQGDGFMLAFSSARRALQCAITTQRAFEAYNSTHPDTPVRVRMGLHVGETIKEGDDFLGKAVHYAARIADQANGGEILVSSLVKELTDSAGDITFENGRSVELKGLSNAGHVYSVVWAQ